MTDAATSKFHEMVLEVEMDEAGAPGVFSKICGLTSRGINRSHNMSTTEVPDCDDESIPSKIRRGVRSSEVTISASGVMARQSHTFLLQWWKSGETNNIRLFYANAEAGDVEYESGPAFLQAVNNSTEKGDGSVTAELSIEFDGVPEQEIKA